MSALDAVVLAGGASRRMGTDKPSIVIDGQTLLRRSIDAVLLAGAERVVVVGRGRDAVEWISHVAAIADSVAGSGPLGAFLDGLHHLEGVRRADALGPGLASEDAVLLVAADHPDLQADELRFVADRLRSTRPDTMAVIPVVDGRDQMLHAAYRPSVARPFGESFATGERSLHRALSGQVTVRIARFGEDRRSYLDLDNPTELDAYRRARAAGRKDSSG